MEFKRCWIADTPANYHRFIYVLLFENHGNNANYHRYIYALSFETHGNDEKC